jgi:HEAT repeat protein
MSGPNLARLALALAAALAALPAAPQGDLARELRSKDPLARVAALALVQPGDAAAAKLAVAALSDKDWEVVEVAAAALGRLRERGALAPLAKLAIEAPLQRQRRAAALALAQIDAAAAAEALLERAKGKGELAALQAFAIVAPSLQAAIDAKPLERALKHKEPQVRAAAAAGLAALPRSSGGPPLAELLADADARVRCAALAGSEARADPSALPELEAFLGAVKLPGVLERRARRALAGLAAGESGRAAVLAALEKHAGGVDGAVAARWLRLAAELRAQPGEVGESAWRAIERGLDHADARVRSAAARAADGSASAPLLAKLAERARGDPDAHVRLIALRSLAATPEAAAAALEAAVALLERDGDATVREEAAVTLGVEDRAAAMEPLVRALGDGAWEVSVCAAVSLGKTRAQGALAALSALAKDADWRRRGGAVMGLTRLHDAAAAPALIAAVEDPEPAVAATAQRYLAAATKADVAPKRSAWEAWWAEHGSRVRFPSPAEQRRRREKYGYATMTAAEIYEDLDVVVLESRGDHIQELLEKLEIDHRLTAAARVAKDGLHPGAVYVSNCTGEIEPADVERLRWFVLAGGYLFGSCWSLHETIEKVYPGVVRRFETASEVLDDVEAEPCAPSSSYLEGVFEGGWRPVYHLEGAHLIEVLDPERCEVLIDSPQSLARWGAGDLAASFRAGHGLILDSVNHFDLQGLEVAPGLKTAEDRQAFAIDHMGLAYADWRRLRDEPWWGSALKASARVDDLSAFRFVTNFVRLKRLREE